MTPGESHHLQHQIIAATGTEMLVQETIEAFKQKLAAFIHELINHDFEKLVSILYRLDISEQKLKILLAEKTGTDAGLLIAEAIVERQMEKMISRKKYAGTNRNIPEDEKW